MTIRPEENSLKDLEARQNIVPFEPVSTSYGMGWKGLQAVRYRNSPLREFSAAYTPGTHVLFLYVRPPEKMEVRYEGVKRDMPPPPGSIAVVPAGSSVVCSRQGSVDSLLIYLDPSLVARVAESFEFDPSRTLVQPVDGLNAPGLRSAMLAVDTELKAGGVGGPLMVDALATMLSVHLIRRFLGPRHLADRPDGELPRRKLRTVIEYIMENLEGRPTLEQMAAAVHLSPYYFARQFKAATGLPPHQYVITRRIERAQHLLWTDGELGLAEVALRVGFSDQSQFSFHFKRIVGVTPRRFRISARRP